VNSVVVSRCPDLARLAAPLLAEHAPPAVLRADPPDSALSGGEPGYRGLVGQESVAELRIVAVCVEQRVGQIGLLGFGVGEWLLQLPVVGLASDLEHPARHHHANPVGGQLAHERVEPFRKLSLRQIRGGPPEDLVLLLQQPFQQLDLALGRPKLNRLARRNPRLDILVDIGCSQQPRRQRHRMDPEVGGDLLQGHPGRTVAGHPDDIVTELAWIRLGHGDILPAPLIEQGKSAVTCPCSRPNVKSAS